MGFLEFVCSKSNSKFLPDNLTLGKVVLRKPHYISYYIIVGRNKYSFCVSNQQKITVEAFGYVIAYLMLSA